MTTEEPTAQAEAPSTTWFLVGVPTEHVNSFLAAVGSYPGGFSLTSIREPSYEEEDALRFGTSPEPRT
jgi:hypothetical protein